MRLIIPTTTLFTVAFLATLMSNTENADRANAKLALGLTADDLPEASSGSENPELIEEPVTEGSPSAPENIPMMEFATLSQSNQNNQNANRQLFAKSISRSVDRVRDLELEGASRSPVFIPEFSAKSPWAHATPDRTSNPTVVSENSSVQRNSSLSRAMPSPIFPRKTAVAQPVSHSVPQILEQPSANVLAARPDRARPDSRRDRALVPALAPNSTRDMAAVPATGDRVQPVVTEPAIPGRDRRSLPAFSSGESIPVQDNTQRRPAAIQGSAKDLLPIGETESTTSPNSSTTIAVVQSPNPSEQIAQTHNNIYRPNPQEVEIIERQVENLQDNAVVKDVIEGSPSFTIVNPTGYGADNNTGFVSATYQSRVRNTESDDGALVLGFGLGDARENVGVELSYTLTSVSGENRNFGTGGFNVKLHRQFADDWAIAAGWNGFVRVGDGKDDEGFENSIYGVVSKVIRTQESIDSPFSRIALSAGVGNGQFRTEDALRNDDDGVNVFGSAAVRVAKPVSVIAEWTGQDLALGASIAPFKNIPFVITPAVRDIAGAGDGARFVLGTGVGFRF